MKSIKYFSIVLMICLISVHSSAQINVGKILKKVASSGASPTENEIGAGIKEALEKGISAGSDRLSAANGFLNNNAVKILFPPEALKAEKTLRSFGLNKLCDDMILSLNRAAEDAAKEAKPIFVAAIKQMSVKDATNILLSKQQDSATQYFKTATTAELSAKFQPIIQASLDKVNATKYWTDVTTTYNKTPLVAKVNTDLKDYVTQKAISGLFYEVAEEELKIRNNSAARNTELLQKVFGYADKNK